MNLITRADAIKLGLRRYFDGVQCKLGHIEEKLVSNYKCIRCNRIDVAEWQKANVDKKIQYVKNWRIRTGWKRNAEKDKIYSKNYWSKNPEKLKLRNKRKNRRIKEMYPEKHRERKRIYKANRRAYKRQSGGRHTLRQIKELYKKQGGKCVNCLSEFEKSGYHIDHIFPISRGGRNDISNIQLLCPPCNIAKGSLHPLEFAKKQGRLL